MSRNHTFLTRGLALVMALVMIVSCANLGLVLTALAADNGESLYALVSNSTSGTAELRAILGAGGLSGDETISYAKPTAADADALLELRGGNLTAESYDAGYMNASWVPYSYGTVGTENLFNGANTVAWEGTTVNVIYTLNLGEIGADALALAAQLANEAAAQDEILSNIYNNYQDNLKQLRKGTLNGLKDEVEYSGASAEVIAEFIEIIDNLRTCIDDATGNLYFYHMLENYDAEGLAYYYQNQAAVVAEINTLSSYLNDLVGSQEKIDALETICTNLEYEGYAEKFVDLAKVMSDAAKNLTAPNAAIDVTNTALVKALEAAGKVTDYEVGEVVLYSTNLYVLDSTYSYAIVTVNGPSGHMTITKQIENGVVLTAEMIAEIIADAEATAASMLGDKAAYYTLNTAELDALVGTESDGNVEAACNWEANEYTVKINGEDDQIVTINDLTVTLPAHPQDGHSYTYIIGNATAEAGEYTFTVADLDNLFVDGVLTIEREDVNDWRDNLVELVDDMNDKVGKEDAFVLIPGEEGDFVGLIANIEIGQLVDFGEVLIQSDYNRVELNNEIFCDDEYISVQTLINAILNDNGFNNERMIKLGQEGKGLFLNTTMQLQGYDLAFELNLSSVPAEMETASKALNAVKDYMSFQSNEGILDVTLTLPEKAYEAYVTAAIGAGYADDDEMENINNIIALQFVEDNIKLLMESDVDTTTYTNTLATIGIERDLTQYQDYYQFVKDLVNSDGFDCTPINNNLVEVSAQGSSDNIARVLNLLGLNSDLFERGKSMIKTETLHATAKINLTNDASDFEALVINPAKIKETGAKNKINAVDYTTNLVETVASMSGKSLVILLDDVYGNLNFPAASIIDLNGNTIHGSINVNGGVVIVDSALDTYNGGAVTGSVSATRGAITGGTFGSDVSAFLKDGYYQDGGSVRNALYYIDNNNGTFNFVLNGDFYQSCEGYLPSVKALGVEIAADLAMSFYPAAALSYGSNTIYSVNIDNILGSYLGNGTVDAGLTDLVNSVYASGINALANDIIDDLCDFKALSAAIEAGDTLCSYGFTVNPLTVDFNHVADGNYLDFSLVANGGAGKSFTVALTIDATNEYYDYAKDLLAAMAEIVTVDAQVELQQPTYDAAGNTLSVGGNAYADIVIDLSTNSDYTKGLAIILAYGNPEWTEEIANAKNCVLVLNKIIAQMTVEDVFTALKEMNRNVSMTEMADAIGYKYSADEIQNLEKVYHVVLCGIGKTLEVMEDNADSEPVGSYLKNFSAYKEALAILLAYSKEEWSDDLANAKDAAVVLKNIIAQMDVQDFFDALKAIDSNVTIAKMADAIGYDISDEEINVLEGVLTSLKNINARVTVKEMADAVGYEFGVTENSTLEDVRDILEYALGKIGDKLNINNNENVLGSYQTNGHTFTYSMSVSGYGDATVKGYTGVFDVTSIEGSMTIKLAPKCTGLIGDVDWDGDVDTDDAALICGYDVYLNSEDELHLCVADVNADGAIDTDDAALICAYDVGLIEYEDFPAVNP